MLETVYRIEHRESRRGPFSGPEGYYNDLARDVGHPDCYRLPGPTIDCGDGTEDGSELREVWRSRERYLGDYHFGFASRQQLVAWFTSASGRSYLAQCGFHVAAYQVARSDLLMGNHQVAFNSRAAQLIGSYDLLTLMPAGEC